MSHYLLPHWQNLKLNRGFRQDNSHIYIYIYIFTTLFLINITSYVIIEEILLLIYYLKKLILCKRGKK